MCKMHKGKSEIMRKRLQNIQKVQIIHKNEKNYTIQSMENGELYTIEGAQEENDKI